MCFRHFKPYHLNGYSELQSNPFQYIYLVTSFRTFTSLRYHCKCSLHIPKMMITPWASGGESKGEHLLPLDFAHILPSMALIKGLSWVAVRWHRSCLEPLQLCVYKH